MSGFSITQGGLVAHITDNSGKPQDGSSYWVNVCINSGGPLEWTCSMQVIKSRSYRNLKNAQRGALKMMKALDHA